MKEIVIIKTGVANLASVIAGFKRAGTKTKVSVNPKEVINATHVMLPGVGHFGAGIKALEDTGLAECIRERLDKELPTMSICLGMQMLFEKSEESIETTGLGLVKGNVKKFSGALRVPQLGWNYVKADDSSKFIKSGYAYFANSYHVADTPQDWICAKSNYGSDFVAGMENGNFLALQFHPELSGKWGLEIIKRWTQC